MTTYNTPPPDTFRSGEYKMIDNQIQDMRYKLLLLTISSDKSYKESINDAEYLLDYIIYGSERPILKKD